MSNGEGGAVRETTLEAVHSDQLSLQDQLRDLSNVLTRIEEHLIGGPKVQMRIAAGAQEAALKNPLDNPALGQAAGILAPSPGKLPQMCELGVNNSQIASDLHSRLTHLTGILGVPNQ